MKKLFFNLVLLSSFINLLAEYEFQAPNKITRKKDSQYYKLNSKFLEYLDGVSNRMDGSAIGEVIQVKKLIEDLKSGILESKGKNKEYIIFQEQKKTIAELCSIEYQILKKYNNEKDIAVRSALGVKLDELKACLKDVKHSFIQATIPFMKRIEPAKPVVIKIMEESCRIRNIAKTDTVMLDWANTNGNEEAVFNDRIKNFSEFSKFLMQVANFLGDLAKSCPKGFNQYLALKKS